MRNKLLLLLISLLASVNAEAGSVRLPKLFGDCMVLQRDVELEIWGWADPGTIVTVRFNGSYHEAVTDESGRWTTALPPQKAGGPYLMEINETVIRDVLVGDVWLCSGQSNQETPIHRLTEKFPEINVSDNHMIRHFKVPTQNTPDQLQEDLAGNACWHSGVASQVMNWTALAYFYAQEAYAHTGVPQGMIVSSLGGSEIESWISRSSFRTVPTVHVPDGSDAAESSPVSDAGEGRWHVKDLDDSDWEIMNMPGTWKENGLDVRGTVWMRKDFDVPEVMAGRHAKLSMGTLVHNDRVYVNGVFVGSTGYEYPPRRYHIPAGVLVKGRNTITVRLDAPAGNGEFIKDKPYEIVGDAAEIDLTGEWKYKVGADLGGRGSDISYKTVPKKVSGLYNGMIYPLRKYRFSGVIWYQGESNAGSHREYAGLVSSLISEWRALMSSPRMPFLLVQLPNFMQKQPQPCESSWAGIREAQLNAFKTIPYTSLAVTYDVGEWNDIHPLDKKSVAQRLFLGARKLVYMEDVEASGPVYESMEINDGKIIITFTHAGKGLRTKDGQTLRHFAIAGADGRFVWAEAVIKGKKVVVSSPEVVSPVAVRYAWSDNPSDANLVGENGLLASPFRTDSW